MNQFNNIVWNFNPFKGIEDFFANKFNDFLIGLVEGLMNISTELCLIVGLVAAILYIFGWNGGKKIPFIAWGVHLLIRIIGGVILGV